jgi:hypothetical protein
MTRVNITYIFTTFLGLLFFGTACKKIIQVDLPVNRMVSDKVFENDGTAAATVINLYSRLVSNGGLGSNSVTYLAALSADEITVEKGVEDLQFYRNQLQATNSKISLLWAGGYDGIGFANTIIEGLRKSQTLTEDLKKQLLGEALFIRAFQHFYQVNLFGDIPYVTTTDYEVSGLIKRMPIVDVYDKIVADLVEAKTLLPGNYLHAKQERVRVNKWVATAFLARIYLYEKDWVHAEEQASSIIKETALYSLVNNLDSVFLKNSTEAIWQLIPAQSHKYTDEGVLFNQPGVPKENVPVMYAGLYDAFENGDKRKQQWVGEKTVGSQTWKFPFKYKKTSPDTIGNEYSMVLRLAEQYLVRAEARAQQNKLTGAASDLNVVRNRAGLDPTGATDQTALLGAIERERRVELFTEWGDRWLNLKRTDHAANVLSGIKPGWGNTDALYPIPYTELTLNPNMEPNPGY